LFIYNLFNDVASCGLSMGVAYALKRIYTRGCISQSLLVRVRPIKGHSLLVTTHQFDFTTIMGLPHTGKLKFSVLGRHRLRWMD